MFHVWERSRPANRSILTEHQITNLSIPTRWQELPAGLHPSQHGETFHYWGHRCQSLPSTYSKMSKAPSAFLSLFLRINPHSFNTYGGQHKELDLPWGAEKEWYCPTIWVAWEKCHGSKRQCPLVNELQLQRKKRTMAHGLELETKCSCGMFFLTVGFGVLIWKLLTGGHGHGWMGYLSNTPWILLSVHYQTLPNHLQVTSQILCKVDRDFTRRKLN